MDRLSTKFVLVLVTLLLASVTLAGCRCSSKRPGVRRKPVRKAKAKKGITLAADSVRPLVKEASRAELDQEGLFIDFGTPDQTKYLRGGYFNRIGEAGKDGEQSFQMIPSGTVLNWHDWRGGKITAFFRLRAMKKKSVFSLVYNKKKETRGRTLGTGWEVVEIPLPQEKAPGRRTLRLVLEGQGKKHGMELDWAWFRRKGVPGKTPVKVGLKNFGTPKRSLLAGPSRTVSYYMHLPYKSALVFHYGAAKPTDFEVMVAVEGQGPKRVFRSQSGDGKWHRALVNLRPWHRKMVRLIFRSSSPGGAAAWGDPRIRRIGRTRKVPAIRPDRLAKNMIHILVDAARWDVYRGINRSSRVRTPGFDDLARRGVLFTGAYANANYTLPSLASFLSGRHQFTFFEDVHGKPKVPSQVPLLQEYLQNNGFYTFALCDNPHLSKNFNLHRGWDHLTNYPIDKKNGSSRLIYDSALEFIRKHRANKKAKKKRFYMYLHTMDPHWPYVYHEKTTSLYFKGKNRGKLAVNFSPMFSDKKTEKDFKFSKQEKKYLRALYQGEITFHERQLRRFVAELEALGVFKDTLVVYSADHGEELLEHGRVGHGTSLYQELQRIPLVLVYPRLFPQKRRVHSPVSLLDLLPTQLEALGLPQMPDTHGSSLRPSVFGIEDMAMRYVVMTSEDRAVIVGRHKLIWEGRKGMLFDLVRDPGEHKSILEQEPLARRVCEVHLSEALAVPNRHLRLTSTTTKRIKGEGAVLDKETRKQLKGLGYIK